MHNPQAKVQDWSGKKVVVTGGAGFLGRFVVQTLQARGCTEVFVPRSAECDLREKSAIQRLLHQHRPDVIFHLAAVVGGIGANQRNPGSFFYDNAIMGIQLLEVARQMEVGKVVVAGTICSYPKITPVPFREADLWAGYPEETNAPYGLAKKMLLVQSQAYREQYGFNSIYLLPVNLFGPGDNFDLENSHVIPALIRKGIEAKEKNLPEVVLWGDGSPTREFLYVEDAALGLVQAAEGYDGKEPVNLGSGVEISIRELATLIFNCVGYHGKVRWDTARPNGQPRRCLDTTRAKSLFGFTASHSLRAGLEKTLAWFLTHRNGQVPSSAISATTF